MPPATVHQHLPPDVHGKPRLTKRRHRQRKSSPASTSRTLQRSKTLRSSRTLASHTSCPPCTGTSHFPRRQFLCPASKYRCRTAPSPSSRNISLARPPSSRTRCRILGLGSWCTACRASAGAQASSALTSLGRTAGRPRRRSSTSRVNVRPRSQIRVLCRSWGSSRARCAPHPRGCGKGRRGGVGKRGVKRREPYISSAVSPLNFAFRAYTIGSRTLVLYLSALFYFIGIVISRLYPSNIKSTFVLALFLLYSCMLYITLQYNPRYQLDYLTL